MTRRHCDNLMVMARTSNSSSMESLVNSGQFEDEHDAKNGNVTPLAESNEMLVYTSLEVLPKTNFSEEVRASLDVHKFPDSFMVLLDISGLSFKEIIQTMLHKVI